MVTGLEIPAVISLSGRESPLRMKLTSVEKRSIRTEKPFPYEIEALDQIGLVMEADILSLYLSPLALNFYSL